ncbi:LacI family DNA-binding transcriptional regulator [Streptomyces sp. SL13]|uniref:LacI family DNA-binding transcriptional regulator n=1 Tax=Streptantibioticus silvisoli TaxID=2705255 RepID=A0AA90K8K8_9ACTN|nr:LacI family DNA-binding transcriptional regulator [Streptantibioticus silvisoli]MDI5963727.1 LacI family DNA-binding transcriptional regulator [Streptantibioticus silvisoli]MDI5969567.1 LacI family DNA-binding transcriptional regulator [Streptantibioticus silvisoli]
MTRRLAEVARKVGVSEATVSRVLNGKPGVSDSTRRAVLTALDVLGYERPTQLRGVRARLVGLVLPELQNPIFPALAEVVGGALVQLGFTPVLCTRTAGGLTEAEYVAMLLDQQVSGVVFCGGLSAEEYQHLLGRGVPVVLLNAAVDYSGMPQEHFAALLDGGQLGFPQVSTDDAAAVEQAFHHLTALGHRDIALMVGPADHTPSRRKTAAFNRLAERARMDTAGRIGQALFSFEGGQAVAAELLAAGATALICGSDILALGAVRAARRAGLSVPGDVSVVGFDDSAFMNYTDPPLTTLRQPIEAMARAAVTLLVNQIDGNSPAPKELLHEPELVVRGSTAPRTLPAMLVEHLARS